jgi:putative nucleotidyltransferase with HDIG domain
VALSSIGIRRAASRLLPAFGAEGAAAAAESPAPRSIWLLVAAAGVAGCLLTVVGALSPEQIDWKLLVFLALLALLAELFDLSMYGDSRVSLAFVPIFAALMLYGLAGLAVVVPVAMLASAFTRPPHKTIFNFGALMLAGGAAYGVLLLFGPMADPSRWPQVLLPALLAAGTNFGVNSLLVATAIAVAGRSQLRKVWAEHFMWLWPHYLVLGLLGLAMASAYTAKGFWGVAVFLAPPLMMRLSLKQYLDRTTRSVLELREAHEKLTAAHEQVTSAMDSLGHAYDGTLRSLVAALDARDSETAGHSERVAELTMAIAAEMGLPAGSEEWRYIAWGALLHDVGKIAIPDEILRKSSFLTDEEWESMRRHPGTGYDILRTVDFLAPAAEIVLAHHERFDGAGYPNGLAGEEIPFGARIFMIADAFDAMTSNRSYRPAMPAEEALAEILRNSGTQFDPAAVRAFLSVYQKRFVEFTRLRSNGVQLSETLKKAIAEAAGLDVE